MGLWFGEYTEYSYVEAAYRKSERVTDCLTRFVTSNPPCLCSVSIVLPRTAPAENPVLARGDLRLYRGSRFHGVHLQQGGRLASRSAREIADSCQACWGKASCFCSDIALCRCINSRSSVVQMHSPRIYPLEGAISMSTLSYVGLFSQCIQMLTCLRARQRTPESSSLTYVSTLAVLKHGVSLLFVRFGCLHARMFFVC